MIRSVNVPAK